MKKYFSIWLHFAKISLQRLFEYRADFFLWSLVSTGWTIFSLLFYQILFLQTSNIAGWNKQQMLVFAGTYMIIDAATWSIFWRNIQNYTQSIFNGTLDFLLLQPIDAQFRLSVRHISFTNVPRLIIGIILLALNLPTVTLSQVLMYIALIFLSMGVIYTLWFFTATFTFWVEKLDNIIEIVPTLRRIWSMPSDIYSGFVSAMLTIIIPLALITTTPTRVLLHQFRWQELVVLLTFFIILFGATRAFFHYSVKKYSGIGS